MPRKRAPLDALGSVECHHDAFCAQCRYRDEAGLEVRIRGPYRKIKVDAEADLAQIRAAGAVGQTREQGLQN